VQRSKLGSEAYLVCILFGKHRQLDFLGFPQDLQANAAPASTRVPRTLSFSLYPFIILYALSILDGVNVPLRTALLMVETPQHVRVS
jgi:hypothetical protein